MFVCDEESEYQKISAIQAPKILAIQSSLWTVRSFERRMKGTTMKGSQSNRFQ